MNDKATSILSYQIDTMVSNINIFHSNDIYVGRMAVVSDNPYQNDLFWIMDTAIVEVNLEDEIHLFYGADVHYLNR